MASLSGIFIFYETATSRVYWSALIIVVSIMMERLDLKVYCRFFMWKTKRSFSFLNVASAWSFTPYWMACY